MADAQAKVGLKAVYRFKGDSVHAFDGFPTDAESSNEYESVPLEERENHSFLGKLDGGVLMPVLKSTGPYAKLVTALKRAKEDSEGFLKDKVEGPVPAKLYEQ